MKTYTQSEPGVYKQRIELTPREREVDYWLSWFCSLVVVLAAGYFVGYVAVWWLLGGAQ